jgi:hypothetical protein
MQNANDDERSGWQRQHGHNDQDIIRPQRSESKSRCGERQENVLKAKPETRTWKVFVSHSAPISPPRNAINLVQFLQQRGQLTSLMPYEINPVFF